MLPSSLPHLSPTPPSSSTANATARAATSRAVQLVARTLAWAGLTVVGLGSIAGCGQRDECYGRANQIYYADVDGDGFGDPNNTIVYCLPPEGYVDNLLDCDDLRPQSFPGASEICDGFDNDCDGLIDEDLPQREYWEDRDNDGWGNLNRPLTACAQPQGYATQNPDCNDDDPSIFPGAPEVCNGVDDNCNGLVDDADPNLVLTTATRWWYDLDADGFGDPNNFVDVCVQLDRTVDNDLDCDDDDDTIKPNAIEVCDGVDNDCDGLVDDVDPDLDRSGMRILYEDADGDGFGNPAKSIETCYEKVWYHVDNGDDCDDTDPRLTIEADAVWYPDADGDGWADGDAEPIVGTCIAPAGYLSDLEIGDCDDDDDTINPDATEICDGIDNNCSGLIDDEDPAVSGETTARYWPDLDGDGYGDADLPLDRCWQPPEAVLNGLDCDDDDPLVNPDAVEICDGIDNNCSGLIDDADPLVDLSTIPDWFIDNDGDGFGDIGTLLTQCNRPNGFVQNADDCDDNNPLQGPPSEWQFDRDGDNWGAGTIFGPVSCLAPGSPMVPVRDQDDCNDDDPTIYPGAPEVCFDGIDQDCDGADLADFSDSQCVPPEPQINCALAQTIAYLGVGTYNFSSTNVGAGNNLNLPLVGSCTSYQSTGNDRFIGFEVPPGGTLDASMTATFDASLYVVTDCTNASTCLVGSDTTVNGGTESVSLTNNTGLTQTLFVVADAFGSATGTFTLTITIRE